MPSEFVKIIRSAFLDALYAFLDGLVHVAFSSPDDADSQINVPLTPSTSSRAVITDSKDTRIMLTVSNLAHLQAVSIQRTINQFQAAFGIDMTADSKVSASGCECEPTQIFARHYETLSFSWTRFYLTITQNESHQSCLVSSEMAY